MMETPSKTSNLTTGPTTVFSETTNTFRRLYLKSEQADISYSPTHKVWTLPPTESTSTTSYRARLLSLELYNCFPSVPVSKFIRYRGVSGDATLTIPPGDWNALTFAAFLTESFKTTPTSAGMVTVTYNYQLNRFQFSPGLPLSLDVSQPQTDAHKELGLLPTLFYSSITESSIDIDFTSVTQIQVQTSWSANNLPITGKLASLPNDTFYTDLIKYYEPSGDPLLVTNQDLSSIEIDLRDQDGKPLYERIPVSVPSLYSQDIYPNWSCIILLDRQFEANF